MEIVSLGFEFCSMMSWYLGVMEMIRSSATRAGARAWRLCAGSSTWLLLLCALVRHFGWRE